MKKRITWCLAAGGTIGLALVMAALALVLTGSRTPTASAQAPCTLTLTKTADRDIVPEGGTIEYTLVVTNTGDAACAHVVVTDTNNNSPSRSSCVDATESGSGGFTDAGCVAGWTSVVWTAASSLAADASATLTIQATANTGTDGETINNTATVTDTDIGAVLPVPATESVLVNDCNLSITKDSDVGRVPEGGNIVYTIDVHNDGSATCSGVVITDTIPDDTDCVDTAVVDDQSDVSIDDAKGCDASGDVTWAVADDMAPDDNAEVQMTVELTSGAKHGDVIDNIACVTSDDTATTVPVCDELTNNVTRAPTATPTATATSTPTPTRTPTPFFTPFCPPCSGPTSGPMATLQPPATGDGPDGSGTNWIAIGMGLGVLALLIGFSAVLARKRIRVR